MSNTNGKPDLEEMRTKALVDRLTAYVNKKLEGIQQHRLSEISPMDGRPVHVFPNATVHQNVVVDAVAREMADRQERARSEDRVVLKNLIDAALSLPVPMVQSPDHPIQVNPTPVTFDLEALADALDSLATNLSESTDAGKAMAQVIGQLTKLLGSLSSTLVDVQETNKALLRALNRERPKSEINLEFSDDGRSAIIKR